MMGKAKAYGGVVVDAEGRVLLREPSNHYDGYVWTFAKGRPVGDEAPEETALRETLEETGISAEVLARIPGTFEGRTTENVYFLMRPTGNASDPDGETAQVLWASAEKARELIRLTINSDGRRRDLAVLDAAITAYAGLSQ
jgi:8-oxo-dGTP diphosphatase